MSLAALIKPVGELTADDIRELVSWRTPEGEGVEFKGWKSSNDVAINAQNLVVPTEGQKRSIVKEVVAFANGSGGRIFLGIGELDDESNSAGMLEPIVNCANVAENLRRSCDDAIDPPILQLEIREVETSGDGSGVVVFNVPESRRAPHMSTKDRRCYRRRGSESKPMDMRDIQDMVLRSNSRYTEIEAEFARREQEFATYLNSFRSTTGFGYCLRLSYVPLDDIDLGRTYRDPETIPEMVRLSATLSNRPEHKFWVQFPSPYFEDRPIIRGMSRRDYSFISGRGRTLMKMDIWSNGGLEIWFGQNELFNNGLRLYADWLVTLFANGLRNVGRIRRSANLSSVSYGLEAQLHAFGKPVVLYDFGEIEIMTHRGLISIGDHVLPRSEVGPFDDFNALVNQFVVDWFNDAGRDWTKVITLNYNLEKSTFGSTSDFDN